MHFSLKKKTFINAIYFAALATLFFFSANSARAAVGNFNVCHSSITNKSSSGATVNWTEDTTQTTHTVRVYSNSGCSSLVNSWTVANDSDTQNVSGLNQNTQYWVTIQSSDGSATGTTPCNNTTDVSTFTTLSNTPTVTSVTTSTIGGAYRATQTVNVTVNFSVNVNVTGTPVIALNTAPARDASCAAGNNLSSMICTYTIQAGDTQTRLDYTSTSALTLPGGATIKAASDSTTDAALTLPATGSNGLYNQNILIDTTAPTAPTSVSINPSGWSNSNAYTISWTNPADGSGFSGGSAAYYYKIGSAPTGTGQGTALNKGTSTSLAGLSQGNNTVYFWLKDAAGNEGWSSTATVTAQYDSAAPTGLSAGADVPAAAAQFTQVGTAATDPAPSSGTVTYQWSNQSTNVGTITFGSGTATTTTISADTNGTYTIRLTATDPAGNTATDDMILTWYVQPTGTFVQEKWNGTAQSAPQYASHTWDQSGFTNWWNGAGNVVDHLNLTGNNIFDKIQLAVQSFSTTHTLDADFNASGASFGSPVTTALDTGQNRVRLGIALAAGTSTLQTDEGATASGFNKSGSDFFSNSTAIDGSGSGAYVQIKDPFPAFDEGATYNCAYLNNGSNGTITSINGINVQVFNFSSFTLAGTCALTGSYPVQINVRKDVNISGTFSANGGNGGDGNTSNGTSVGGIGYAGGSNGGGGNGWNVPANSGSGAGGGGGAYTSLSTGGGGGYGAIGGNGVQCGYGGGCYGVIYGDTSISTLYGGSGGGGSESLNYSLGAAGAGGAGGGVINIRSLSSINLNSGGSLQAKGGIGGAGHSGGGAYGPSGPGGSGGAIKIEAPTISLNSGSALNADGGSSGNAEPLGHGGGGGGGGRIYLGGNIAVNSATITANGGTALGAVGYKGSNGNATSPNYNSGSFSSYTLTSFSSTATYASYIDSGSGDGAVWKNFKWTKDETNSTTNSNITFKIKTSSAATVPSDIDTSGCSIDVSGKNLNQNNTFDLTACAQGISNKDRYLFYKATFNAGTTSAANDTTPRLNDVQATWNDLYYSSGAYTSPTINAGGKTVAGATTLGWGSTANGGAVKMQVGSSNETYSDSFDGASINLSKWSVGQGAGTTVQQTGGKIQITSTRTTAGGSNIGTINTFPGDFDVQVDYDATNLTANNYLMMVLSSTPGQWNLQITSADGTTYYPTTWTNTTAGTAPDTYSTTLRVGKIRAVRNGSTLNFYILDANSNGWRNFYRFTSGNGITGAMGFNLNLWDSDGLSASKTAIYDNFIAWGNNAGNTTGGFMGPQGTTGPVALYHLDGTVGNISNGATIQDATGQNNGTFSNANNSVSTTTGYATAKIAQGITFDGVDDYVSLSGSGGLQNVTSGNYSLEGWVNPNSVPAHNGASNCVTGCSYAIVGRTGWHTTIRYDENKKFVAEVWNSVPNAFSISSTQTYNPGAWHHVAMAVNDSEKKIYLYVDGSQAATPVSYTGTLRDFGTSAYYIGSAGLPGNQWSYVMDGKIDEVAIYNRVLSQQEIFDHYAGGAPANNLEQYYYYSTSGQTLNAAHNGSQYYRYKAVLTTPDVTQTPTLNDATLNYQTYPTSSYQIVQSVPYNTLDSTAAIQRLFATNNSTGTLKFQLRTAPDNNGVPGTWGNWCGTTSCSGATLGDGTLANDYYFIHGNPPSTVSTQRDGSNDQWFQYATFLKSSDGSDTPIVDNVSVEYRFNTAPVVKATLAQMSSSNLMVNYNINSQTGEETTANVQLFYQPSGVVTNATVSSGQAMPYTLNLTNSQSSTVPASGSVLIDNELFTFNTGSSSSINLTGRAQNFVASYATYAANHSTATPIYFLASGGTLSGDTGTLTGLTATPAAKSISWASSGLVGNERFKIAANDGQTANNIGSDIISVRNAVEIKNNVQFRNGVQLKDQALTNKNCATNDDSKCQTGYHCYSGDDLCYSNANGGKCDVGTECTSGTCTGNVCVP